MASVRQDINVGLIAFIGLVGSMVLLIVVVGVQAWFGYETDAIREARYASGLNLDWIRLRDEQYANLGDPVGNGTIYASASGELEGSGYRWTSEAKETAVMPIHAAMAAFVAQHGGSEVSAEAMREIDRERYVHLVIDAFQDPNAYLPSDAVRDERQQPQQEQQNAGNGQTDAGEGQ